MCNVCGPGKPPEPARFFLLWSCQMCHNCCGRNIALLSIPLEEMRYIPEPILCELYVVKFWEGMVQNSLSCHAIPKRWACSCFGVPFSPHTLSHIVCS